jgi:predicted nucleic acid-binding protein
MPVELKVIDASALAALLFAEPGADNVAARMGDHRFAAPTLLRYEIASVCLKKIHIYPRQRQGLLQALSLFERMDLQELLQQWTV